MHNMLAVERTQLESALAALGVATMPAKATLTLTYQDGALIIRAPGVEAAASATGQWEGQVSVEARLLQNLRRAGLPSGDPVPVSVASGRLRVGTWSVPCVAAPTVTRAVDLPINPPLLAALRLSRSYAPEEVEAAGLTEWLISALREQESREAAAAKALEPLGVTMAQVQALVASALADDTLMLTASAAEPFCPIPEVTADQAAALAELGLQLMVAAGTTDPGEPDSEA